VPGNSTAPPWAGGAGADDFNKGDEVKVQSSPPRQRRRTRRDPVKKDTITWVCDACGSEIADGRGYISVTKSGRWHAVHGRCDDDPTGYWFGVERCRTHEELLDWDSHLWGKAWLGDTDWEDFYTTHGGRP
jgi:hypothetical protein